MLKMIGAIALVASLAAPGLSAANEADWLYFPMYERDTAHAVDLKALRFRPDGLLASGTRYPRVRETIWTAEQSERGWYDYIPRLIDCETGFFVDTGISLLDRDGKTIATHPAGREEQLERLTSQLRAAGTRPWPDTSETLLACAAASRPALRAARASKARTPPPLISFAPITQNLTADSEALMAQVRRRFDLDAVAKRNPSSARGVFQQLQLQNHEWRRGIAGPGIPAPGLAPTRLAVAQSQLDALLRREGADATVGGIRLLPRGAVEFEDEPSLHLDEPTPAQAAKAANAREKTETMLADCSSGVRIPLAQHWRDRSLKVLLTQPVPAKVALAYARRQLESRDTGEHWDLRRGGELDGSRLGAICRLVARMGSGASAEEANVEPTDVDLTKPFGLNPAQLASATTPEAMLLQVRAAARAQRP